MRKGSAAAADVAVAVATATAAAAPAAPRLAPAAAALRSCERERGGRVRRATGRESRAHSPRARRGEGWVAED